MDSTPLPIPPDARLIPEAGAVAWLSEALHPVSDARRGQGNRYALARILCLLVLGKLAGETSLSGATAWIRHRAGFLAEQFNLHRKTMPCQMRSCKVLARVDAKHLDAILAALCVRWEAEQRCGADPSRLHTPQGQAEHAHLALDGKPLRATTSQPHAVHQLSGSEVTTGIVLWHGNVQEQENESSALKALLTPHLITGRIFTLDAMHTQRALCAQIHRCGGCVECP